MSTEIFEVPTTVKVSAPVETSWTIDAVHSSVQFSIKHLMIANAKGVFKNVESKFLLNSEDITKSYVEATIDAASVSTNIEDRDNHLRSADFFDVAKFPTIKFISKSFEPVGQGELKVHGFLTIKDVTKEVVLNIEGPTPELKDPWGNSKIALSGSTKINRSDFGLVYNAVLEAGGVMLGETVTLTIDAEYAKVVTADPQSN